MKEAGGTEHGEQGPGLGSWRAEVPSAETAMSDTHQASCACFCFQWRQGHESSNLNALKLSFLWDFK